MLCMRARMRVVRVVRVVRVCAPVDPIVSNEKKLFGRERPRVT